MGKKQESPVKAVKTAQGVLSGTSRAAAINAAEMRAVAPSAPNANASARSQAAAQTKKKSTTQKVRDSFWGE